MLKNGSEVVEPCPSGRVRPPDIWRGLDTPANNAGYSTDLFNTLINEIKSTPPGYNPASIPCTGKHAK